MPVSAHLVGQQYIGGTQALRYIVGDGLINFDRRSRRVAFDIVERLACQHIQAARAVANAGGGSWTAVEQRHFAEHGAGSETHQP